MRVKRKPASVCVCPLAKAIFSICIVSNHKDNTLDFLICGLARPERILCLNIYYHITWQTLEEMLFILTAEHYKLYKSIYDSGKTSGYYK